MQQIQPISAPVASSGARTVGLRRRPTVILLVLLVLVVLALVPPLISINRFQRRIATGISLSLGRPVHLDHVSLNLLPLPSLTIGNLVVDEDPSFGSEPIIRSSSVMARLRVGSLWRRRIEFSRISFLDPSINLVRNPEGRWNVENVLLQAARIKAAPTDQRSAGTAPRFPYIEATGARLNLKLGAEKMPFSLTETDFALWLPEPRQWRLRLRARPSRTDMNASDTGVIQIEGTLGRPATLEQVSINLQGAWRNVPMGEASRVLYGSDVGLRGNVTVTTDIQGTVGESALRTTLHIEDLRRADFVPDRSITLDVECLAQAQRSFHAIESIRCGWPVAGGATAPTLALTGSMPDVREPASWSAQIGTSGVPASMALQWVRVVSNRISPDLKASGVLTGSVTREESGPETATNWSGQAMVRDLELSGSRLGDSPLGFGEVAIRTAPRTELDLRHARRTGWLASSPTLVMEPTELDLGGKEPAFLEGRMDGLGCHLHLSGMIVPSRLLALGAAVPAMGEGLVEALPDGSAAGPVRLDLVGERPWGEPQVWSDTAPKAASLPRSVAMPARPIGRNERRHAAPRQ